MKQLKTETLVKIWTVCPNDCELSTQHFETKEQAESWAKTYKDGAQVVFHELPKRVVEAKEIRTARFGYGL